MRNVRFIMKEKIGKILSIVATEQEIEGLNKKWIKFETINEMKEAYLNCQS